jgi:hypothetical protein
MTKTIRAESVAIKTVTWLWEPYIPKGLLTLVAGVPGQGKSMFTCWLAAEVSKKGSVLMSNAEDDSSLIVRPRLEAAGAKLRNIKFLSPRPILPDDTANLIREIEEHRAQLVILDPLQSHMGVSIFSPRATDVLEPFAAECAARDVAFVIVSHTIKSLPKKAHPLHAIGGAAGGIARVVRMAHIFGTHPHDDNQRVLAPIKANFLSDSRKVPYAFVMAQKEIRRKRVLVQPGVLKRLGDEPDVTASQLLRPGDEDGKPMVVTGFHNRTQDKRLHAASWLKGRLASSNGIGVPVTVLKSEAQKAGIAWGTLRRANDEIVKAKKVRTGTIGRRGGGPVHWRLPEEAK